MNTKRCPSCQKLLRADTESCNRCGHNFALSRPTGSALKPIPVTPPASPHRAGHYSGLHPEDQPYQSSMMAVQHSPVAISTQRGSPTPQLQQAPPKLVLPPPPTEFSPVSPAPIRYNQTTLPPSPPYVPVPRVEQPRKLRRRSHLIPILLGIACVLLLITGSMLAFVYVNKKPVVVHEPLLTAQPDSLAVHDSLFLVGSGFGSNDEMSFTHDGDEPVLDNNKEPLRTPTDHNGTFSVGMTIPANWTVGSHSIYATSEITGIRIPTKITIRAVPNTPPVLKITPMSIDLGVDGPGVISHQDITLTNAGGGQISWEASSNQNWLTVTPFTGTFSGSAVAQVTINRGTLDAQSYSGQVTFTQHNINALPLTLTVKMGVEPTPVPASSNLILSSATLSYSSLAGQNPADQTITLQNSGTQFLNWTASVVTGDGNNWLSINQNSGNVGSGSTTVMTVRVHAQKLPAGTYNGVINFSGGTNPQVTVNLAVIAPGQLALSTSSLSFQVTQGQSPAPQTLDLENTGGQTLSWQLSVATADRTKWLSATPPGGQLDPNAKTTVTVNTNIAPLKAGSYSGTLTFTYGTTSMPITVLLTISAPPAAVISLQPGTLNFSTTLGANPAAQSFTITNTGNASLNWSLSEDQNGSTYAPAAATGSGTTIAPAKTATVIVTPNVSQITSAQTLTAVITIADSDSGTTVKSQQVNVTITISSQAALNLSAPSLSFAHDSTITVSAQSLLITNPGTASLNWKIDPASSGMPAWLTLSSNTGTIAPGGNTAIDVTCTSTSMPTGSYSTTLQVSDSDPGSHVAPQTLTVTVTVT